jgi:hypothetical protein
MNTQHPWSESEVRRLLLLYRRGAPIEEMASVLSRPWDAVTDKLRDIGLWPADRNRPLKD